MAEPRVHLGSCCQIDVCTFEQSEAGTAILGAAPDAGGGIATAPLAAPAPTLTLDAAFPEQYAYEVLVFDLKRARRLVAAVEIVSPANKDGRRDYTELLGLLECCDPALGVPPPTYAVTCRKRQLGGQTKLDTWSFPLTTGQPLPSLPVWLSETQSLTLDLETSHEETRRVLRIS